MDKDLYYSLVLDKYLEENDISSEERKLLDEAEQYFMEKAKQNMGIGMMCSAYVFVRDGQDLWAEYSKIVNFLQSYISKYAKSKGKGIEDFSLEFINYGRTQLVYVLTDKETGEKITILAKQPVVEFGKVKQEEQYLKNLNKVDKSVVAPVDYFCDGEQELYVTPYIEQARCVASDGRWGVYVPEPFYRFEDFSESQEKIVNACMIAKLVSLYDFNKNHGIGACKLGGGDFMLSKDWEKKKLNFDNTFDSLFLISAREMLNCSFDEYLEILRSEFSRATINENQDELLVNIRGRVAMNPSDIEKGIEIGKQLIENRVLKNYEDEVVQGEKYFK